MCQSGRGISYVGLMVLSALESIVQLICRCKELGIPIQCKVTYLIELVLDSIPLAKYLYCMSHLRLFKYIFI